MINNILPLVKTEKSIALKIGESIMIGFIWTPGRRFILEKRIGKYINGTYKVTHFRIGYFEIIKRIPITIIEM
jgi:hypothetical protein